MSRARFFAPLAVAAVLTSGFGLTAVFAQQGQQGQGGQGGQAGPPQQPAAAELVFEREVFQYPAFQRRNPFRPLVGEGSGPRFESMRLQGIIYSSADPSRSMALISAGTGEQRIAEHKRAGETWGNVRILEIRPDAIVVEVEEFGLTEQRIMQLPTLGQGGS